MGPYFANVGPAYGPVRHDSVPDAVGMLEAPDNHMPIGIAFRTGRDAAGCALWKLTIGGTELPGRWAIVDREFRAAQ